MSPEYHRLVLIFVDGIGLAPAGAVNPLSQVATPTVRRLLGGPLTLESAGEDRELLLLGIDATLGVAGLPQSATGQAALFTGLNAAEVMGRHVTGLPGPQIRSLVESTNLFKQAVARGWPTTFANAYSPGYLDSLVAGRRRPSVTTCGHSSAGLRFRTTEDLLEQRAVAWDVVRDRFANNVEVRLPGVEAEEAGRHLGRLAASHRLTVYETFMTDLAGHGRMGFTAAETMARIDGLLAGILASKGPRTTLVLTSDHGNFEDSSHRRHTRNPVPLLVVGPLARCFAGVRSILEVTPRIIGCLGG